MVRFLLVSLCVIGVLFIGAYFKLRSDYLYIAMGGTGILAWTSFAVKKGRR